MLNKKIDTRTFVSKQYIFIITYLVGLMFIHSMKTLRAAVTYLIASLFNIIVPN